MAVSKMWYKNWENAHKTYIEQKDLCPKYIENSESPIRKEKNLIF